MVPLGLILLWRLIDMDNDHTYRSLPFSPTQCYSMEEAGALSNCSHRFIMGQEADTSRGFRPRLASLQFSFSAYVYERFPRVFSWLRGTWSTVCTLIPFLFGADMGGWAALEAQSACI